MKRGDTITVDGIGTLAVRSVSGDFVRGRWATGALRGKEACCSRAAIQGRDLTAPAPPATKANKRTRAELQEALVSALKEGPVAVAPWAQERGVEEVVVRGAIGALRKAGFDVRSTGGGKFQL